MFAVSVAMPQVQTAQRRRATLLVRCPGETAVVALVVAARAMANLPEQAFLPSGKGLPMASHEARDGVVMVSGATGRTARVRVASRTR